MEDVFQPLKILTAQEYQLRNIQALTGYKSIPSVIVDSEHLLPFVIKRIKPAYTDIVSFTTIEVQDVLNTARKYDILSNLSFVFGTTSNPLVSNTIIDYAYYKGESTISKLPQSNYQLYLVDSNGNEFYSEVFKVKYCDYKVKIKFRNTKPINNLWFYKNSYMWVEYETFEYSTHEFDEVIKLVYDSNEYEKKTWQRADEIFAINIFGDSTTVQFFRNLNMFDTIYITDQNNVESEIKLIEINPQNSTRAGHVDLEVKYRKVNESLISTNRPFFTWIGSVEGTDPPVIVKEDKLTIGGKYLTIGGKRVKIR